MKLPVAPIQRIAFGVAFCSLAAVGAGAMALVTQPAASSADSTTQQVTYLDPASDEVTTTTEGGPAVAPEISDGAPERAEKAAERAEVAATRSEVAAVKAETIITATTTTTSPTTTTTLAGKPILVTVTEPTIPMTTTTITLPKRWVEIVRLPPGPSAEAGPVFEVPVTLVTGELRISNPKLSYWTLPTNQSGPAALWIGESSTPPDGACYISSAWDTPPDTCALPTGDQTIRIGRGMTYQGVEEWQGLYGNQRDLVVEEYR